MNDRKPKWKKWDLIDDAKIWQVVALSMNLEPSLVKREGNDWMAGGYVNHEDEEFQDRIEVIGANYFRIDATPKALSMNGIAYRDLNIPKFVKWAISVDWELPEELKRRATVLLEIIEHNDITMPAIEKPLSARTENNYLRLIFALAGNIKGFNHNKPYESAKLIIDSTEIQISQETLAGYITKAFELYSKEHG